jgi:uncharacterized protein
MKRWLERHPLSSYFIVAYAVSWSIAVPLALQAQGVFATHLPWWLHYLTLFGPAISAFVIGRLLHEPSSVRRPVTPSIVWWAVGFGSPLLLFVVTQIAARFAGQTPPTWAALGRINFVTDLGVWAWGLWFITSCGEELGWRGFALPRLQRTHSAMTSTLLLSLGWAGWHLPAFFYLPSYAAMGLAIIPGFFLGILAGAIVLTWLYNISGGSVLAAVLWHASFNFVIASPSAGGLTAAVTSTLVMVWAAIIVWRSDWLTLAKRRTAARSVRASREEHARTLPGDALIADSIGVFNHAITIGRPRRHVWPWLAQMGAGTRAGWYSYDVFDNARQPSADRVIPALQTLTVGMIFPALPGVSDGFTVLAFEAERFLVLGWVAPDGTRLMTWAFVLDDSDGGATRLIVRARGGAGYTFHGLPWWAAKPLLTIVHFVMQRKQLLGIARRVEQYQPTVAPNSFPTVAVASMANTPHTVTLAAPRTMGAPPIQAATVPSAIRQNTDTIATTPTIAPAGASTIVSTGTPAPTAKDAADASAAWSGRAASSSVSPSSSRACAAKAPFAMSCRATVRARSGSRPR